MYQQQIEQLVILQQLDVDIVALQRELEEAPKELQDLEKQLADIESRRAQAGETIEMLKGQKRRLEQEIEDDAARIKKSKNKLMLASNTREYHAMMREMDNMEKVNRLREEENMALGEELNRQTESFGTIETDAAKVAEDLAAKRESLESRIRAAQSRLDEMLVLRRKAGEIIPKPILARYEFIRSRLKNPVIVSVGGGICSGCNIAIPPQTYNDLQKGKQIHSCPNCQRLIYWCEHLPGREELTGECQPMM